MNDSDPSTSSPPSNVIPLRPTSSALVGSSPEISNDVEDIDEPHEAADQDADESVGDVLPTIFLDRDFHVVLDAAMRAMAQNDPMLFAKGDQLVRVALDGETPRLLPLGGPQLREVLSSCAQWIREEPVHPPSSVATALAKRGHWRYLRELRALTAFPVLSAKGELRTEQGYDEQTKTFYHATCEVSVPASPTRQDAKRACDLLLDLVSDFPFGDKEHKSPLCQRA